MNNIYKYLVVTFFLIIGKLSAQEKVAELETNYQTTFYSKKESLAISNYKTGELIVLVEDLNTTSVFLLDKDFKLISKLTTPSLISSFKKFLGFSITDEKVISIFFSNNSKKKFGLLNINFKNNTIVQKKLDLKFKKEKIIDGINHKNNFLLLAANRNSNNVTFYAFNNESNDFTPHLVSFSEASYISNGFISNSLDLFSTKSHTGSSRFKTIDLNSPNAIETTASKTKLYKIDDELVFSFDHKKEKTVFAKININDFSKKIVEIEKPILSKNSSYSINHNSFLYQNLVYQLAISPFEMSFTVKEFNNQQLKKEINLKKEDSITFKNGPIIQEGAPNPMFSDRVRKFEKASKFLRKATTGNTGISVFDYNGVYQIKIGGYKEYASGGTGFTPGGFGGVPIGSVGGTSIAFNPTFAAYGSTTSSKSTHIKCLFDKNFKHIKGKPFKSVFNRIELYEKTNKNLKLKNVFYHNNHTYFSYLNTKDKQYHIVEFTTQ